MAEKRMQNAKMRLTFCFSTNGNSVQMTMSDSLRLDWSVVVIIIIILVIFLLFCFVERNLQDNHGIPGWTLAISTNQR